MTSRVKSFSHLLKNRMYKRLSVLFVAAVCLTMSAATTINLSTLTGDTTLTGVTTITGELSGNYKISIADGAKIQMRGVTINGVNSGSYSWAGLTCLGDATIVVAGKNKVKGFYEDYPGIHVPVGKTVTIRGSGLLEASSNGYGAGIGGGWSLDCGNITINGGTIRAEGGKNAAGIGGGGTGRACGNIIIKEATVYATGGANTTAIGCGYQGTCGDIRINGGVTGVRVTATRAASSGYDPIQTCLDGSCGTVTVTSGLIDNQVGDTRTIEPWGGDLDSVDRNVTAFDRTVITGTLSENYKISIAAGATVRLLGATIEGRDESSCPWAGLTCLGDATIILTQSWMGKSDNTIKGFDSNYPGIYVPVDATLTIKGNGSLDASSNGWGAGIGGGFSVSCGNIEILGGTITARGGQWAAGIGGGGNNTCGTISILGGTVTAVGGFYGAGIGYGHNSYSDDITIGPGVTVVATKGGNGTPISTGTAIGHGSLTVPTSADGMSDMTSNGTRTIRPIEWDGDLSSITANRIATDGMTLTGTLSGNYKVSIAAYASVTLEDVTINGVNNSNYDWAGLTCLGDASIYLSGVNAVKGFYEDYPGIYIPEAFELYIDGDGSLTAESNGAAAGIGGGWSLACGNIIIDGGTITARGGDYAAGIGGRNEDCGDIEIYGGTITAIGGEGAPGIGVGAGNCGDITIYSDITRVVATRGDNCMDYIGCGDDGGCGVIDVAEGLLDVKNGNTRTIWRWDGNLATLTSDVVAMDGTVIYGTMSGKYKVTIAEDAEVTLRNAKIGYPAQGTANAEWYSWAGLTCEGDAWITLEGENDIRGFFANYPGIYVPEDATLVISGTGSLDARSNGSAAGIGGGYDMPCGQIVIYEGTITATGGSWAAGIGGGWGAWCDGVRIDGGTVTATGGRYAAGIGCGYFAECGEIMIGDGSVTATGGEGGAGIGSGSGREKNGIITSSACSDISINGGRVTAQGGANAAGIGAGSLSGCGGIDVDYCTVTAVGGANAAGIGSGCGNSSVDSYVGDICIYIDITRVTATCGTGCDNPIGAGVDGDCGDISIENGLDQSRTGNTLVITGAAMAGYLDWASDNGITGDWDDVDAYGIHNVFRYAFDKPSGAFTDPVLLDIAFNAEGKVVVKTPPLVNGEGFAFSIMATDQAENVCCVPVATYPLNPSGETVINETGKTKRFFRLKATAE